MRDNRFIVEYVHSNWNLICKELMRWKELNKDRSPLA
jgi:hypothetical protein